jgi:hypothetical protein
MNIIFGDSVALLPNSFTVLELDTFRDLSTGQKYTAWCVVENIPLQDFPVLDSLVKVHHDLMRCYQERNWEYCRSAIKGLTGKWNGELDTFYQDLAQRIEQFANDPPHESWDGSRVANQKSPGS